MPVLRNPNLPLATPPLNTSPVLIAMECLRWPSQPVAVTPPLSLHRIENGVHMRWVTPVRAVPGVVPYLHGQHLASLVVHHHQTQAGHPEEALEKRDRGKQRTTFHPAHGRARHGRPLGQLPLADRSDAAYPPNHPRDRQRGRRQRSARHSELGRLAARHAVRRGPAALGFLSIKRRSHHENHGVAPKVCTASPVDDACGQRPRDPAPCYCPAAGRLAIALQLGRLIAHLCTACRYASPPAGYSRWPYTLHVRPAGRHSGPMRIRMQSKRTTRQHHQPDANPHAKQTTPPANTAPTDEGDATGRRPATVTPRRHPGRIRSAPA